MRLLFQPGCKQSGLTFHNTQILLALKRTFTETQNIHILLPPNEQEPGLKDLLFNEYPLNSIIRFSDRSEIPSLVREVLKEGPSIVQCQGYADVMLLRPVKMHYGHLMPIVTTTHSFRNGNRFQRIPASAIQRMLYGKYVDYTIFQAHATMDIFVGAGGLLRDKRAGSIPLGLEIDFLNSPMRPDAAVGSPDIREFVDHNCQLVVWLANFSRNKGHFWGLPAIAPALKKYPNARLLLLGEGPEKESMENWVRSNRMGNQMLFPGRIPRKYVRWVLEHTSVAIACTQAETFGHLFTEPMMAGVPIIGTPTGIGKALIYDFLTGFCITWKDEKALCKSLDFILGHPDVGRRMGENARDLVKGWTWEAIAQAYVNLYCFLWDGIDSHT